MAKDSGGMRTGTHEGKGYGGSGGGSVHSRPTLRTYRESVSSASGQSPEGKPTHNQGRNTTAASTKKK